MLSQQQVTYTLPDPALTVSAEAFLTKAKNYSIASPEQAGLAAADLLAVKGKAKEIDALRKSITKPLDDAKAIVMDAFRSPLKFLENAETVLKGAIVQFQQEEARKDSERQAKLAEIARKEQEKLEKQASRAEASGKVEKAESLRESAMLIPLHAVPTAPTKLAGVSTRTAYKAHVTDKAALIAAALSRPDIMALVLIDESKLNKLAAALKENLIMPGVEVYAEEIVSARSQIPGGF